MPQLKAKAPRITKAKPKPKTKNGGRSTKATLKEGDKKVASAPKKAAKKSTKKAAKKNGKRKA